jgi:hypothetical protein
MQNKLSVSVAGGNAGDQQYNDDDGGGEMRSHKFTLR